MAVERTFIGDESRFYPDLGIQAEPGKSQEFESADAVPDDGRWVSATEAKKYRSEIKTAQQLAEATPETEESD